MDDFGDFVRYLGSDMAIKILTHLDDPSDLARVCAASSSWRRFSNAPFNSCYLQPITLMS